MALAMNSLFCESSQAIDLPANIVNSELSPALKTAPRRKVAVRYQAEDLLTTNGSTDPVSSSSQFAVNLVKEIRQSIIDETFLELKTAFLKSYYK